MLLDNWSISYLGFLPSHCDGFVLSDHIYSNITIKIRLLVIKFKPLCI